MNPIKLKITISFLTLLILSSIFVILIDKNRYSENEITEEEYVITKRENIEKTILELTIARYNMQIMIDSIIIDYYLKIKYYEVQIQSTENNIKKVYFAGPLSEVNIDSILNNKFNKSDIIKLIMNTKTYNTFKRDNELKFDSIFIETLKTDKSYSNCKFILMNND